MSKKVIMIEELLNTIYNGNYGYLVRKEYETYNKYIEKLTKKDLIDYVGGCELFGTKLEMLKQMCEICNGNENWKEDCKEGK